MPDFAGAAREALRDLGTHTSCGPATADPAGQIALAQVGVGGSSFARIHLYQAEGAAAGDLDDDLVVTSRADIDPWFHWTSSGYQGVIVNDRNGGARFVVGTFDRGGKFVAAGTDFATAIVPDGTGGSAVLEISGLPGGEVKLSRIDDRGRYGPSATVDDPSASMLIVNWDTGHVLVLATGSSETRGRWYDRGGTALTGWFSAAGTVAPSFAALRLLVDGRAVLSDGERWVASFRDGEARSDPAPSWLADRPGTRLATVRGGRAYALLPAAGGAELEVLTAGGESCGKASVPRSTPAEGTARQPTRLDVGQDGTLLQIENATGDRLGFGVHCALRWWPALLR